MGEVLTPRDRAYLDIIHYGLILLRNFAHGGRLEFCPIEAEHLHEMSTLIGEDNERRHVYYLRGTRGLYLQQLREVGDAEYLEQVSIWYSRPWQVLADAAGWRLPAWDQEAEPCAAADGGACRLSQVRSSLGPAAAELGRSAAEGVPVVMLDEDDLRERQRRIDAAIARASACHMSNAKWRKLFLTLRELGVGRMAWRFVRSDQLSHQPPPPEWALMESCVGDFGVAVGVPYREIDWVEVPAELAAGVAEGLAAVGQFPVRQVASGLRIVGYSWQPPDAEPGAAADRGRMSAFPDS